MRNQPFKTTLPTKRNVGKPTPKMNITRASFREVPNTYSKSRKQHSKEDIEVVLFKCALGLVVGGLVIIECLDFMGITIQGGGQGFSRQYFKF